MTHGSQLYDPLHGFSILIRVENCNALETVMNHGVSETNLTCLDQEKEMNGLWISISEYECEVKCIPSVPDPLFSTQGNAFASIACQGGMDADGL